MKNIKIILPVLLVIMLILGWYSAISGTVNESGEYGRLVKLAEDSLNEGLYEQSIEYYKDTLKYKNDPETYVKIGEIYDRFYEEEPESYVRSSYIADMNDACAAFPKRADFWQKTVELYMENEDYQAAYKTVSKAKNYGVENEELNSLYDKLWYMTSLDFRVYYDWKSALNGYISVFDGSQWRVIDDNGDEMTSNYSMVGLVNDDGECLVQHSIDARIIDKNEITRARFDITPEDAGCYDSETGYTPVKIDGKWKYINESGEFLPGQYDQAGSFFNKKAAVEEGGKWKIIDSDGNVVSENKFEDIKLDMYGRFIEGDVIIAKENGKYHLYNEDLSQISGFECDDIDICIDNGNIAYKSGDKWGFVDTKGTVVCEPKFDNARSFSGGMAAIADDRGLWGFVNRSYKVEVECEYNEAYYFNDSGVAMVKATDETYQLLRFMFD